ncbi:Cna B-type domain-containing protein, partial [Slackia exigua]|uniref:Cna B-type domain-containing protein n=1 Tax=Slackia exigua TaxID=84109 RepID=UPI0028D19309
MKKTICYLMSVILALGICIPGGALQAAFADGGVNVAASITKFEIQRPKGTPIAELGKDSAFYLAMDWKVDDPNAVLHEGDHFDITLPSNVRFPPDFSTLDFDITDADGNVIARAHVEPGPGTPSPGYSGGKVRVTFNDKINDMYNVHGTIYMYALFDQKKIHVNQSNTFSVTVGGKTTSTDLKVTKVLVNPEEVLSKQGKKVNGANEVSWRMRLNYKKVTLQHTIITDSLTGGSGNETYIPGSFTLKRVDFNDEGSVIATHETVDISSALVMGPDNKSFSLTVNNLGGNQYQLAYRTTYTPGTTITNHVKLTDDNATGETSVGFQEQGSGGTAGGDLASKIKLTKVDADDNAVVLKNAVFTVTRPDGTTFELTTGADGTVTSGVLTQGTYKVKEKTPPDGYELNDEEYTLEVTPAGGALKTICDRPVKVNVDVTKKWVGPEGGEVTAHLLADGADTGKELKLNAGNGWKGTFDDLRKYKAGTADEIVYTVKEDPVANYDGAVEGDAASGFTITNTNTETVKVPVEKKWVGPKGSEVTVRLLADGNPVAGKELKLNEGNGWKGEFSGLPKYDHGREIAYTVTEAEVAGVDSSKYGTAVEGDAASGFTITNTNTETVKVPVEKKWVGPKGSEVTVRLLADGNPVAGKELKLNEGNGWKGSFDGLPKFNADGSEIAYTVTEAEVSGVDSS